MARHRSLHHRSLLQEGAGRQVTRLATACRLAESSIISIGTLFGGRGHRTCSSSQHLNYRNTNDIRAIQRALAA